MFLGNISGVGLRHADMGSVGSVEHFSNNYIYVGVAAKGYTVSCLCQLVGHVQGQHRASLVVGYVQGSNTKPS